MKAGSVRGKLNIMFEYSSDDLKDNFFDTADAIADSIPKFVKGDEKLVEGLTEYLLPFFD